MNHQSLCSVHIEALLEVGQRGCIILKKMLVEKCDLTDFYLIYLYFLVTKWAKSRSLKTWMMPRLWELCCPNTKTLITPKCWWPTSQHMFCILGGNKWVFWGKILCITPLFPVVQTFKDSLGCGDSLIQYFVGEWVQYFTKSTENSLADNGSDQVLPVLDHGISASMTSILDAQCQTFSCSNFRQNIAKYQYLTIKRHKLSSPFFFNFQVDDIKSKLLHKVKNA